MERLGLFTFLSILVFLVGIAFANDPITLTFSEMYNQSDNGLSLSSKLEDSAGQTVEFLGYAAPPLKADADFFVLTRYPMGVCPFCESEADWPPDIIYIKLPEGGTDTIIFGALKVTGTLEVGTATDPETGFVSRVRIQADKVERANVSL